MGSINSPSEPRLVIASNRLPLSVRKTNGTYDVAPSSGGLVSALRGLKVADYLWLGWPGLAVNKSQRQAVDDELAREHASAVYLDDELARDHYNGFSNAILWPILHYQPGKQMTPSVWNAYSRVNEIFADTVSSEARDGDLIWVHDYHLFLLPQMLRDRLQAQSKHCPIGFFLHTPFPADDYWRGLPVEEELLKGILGSDVIGFHTDEYKKNFVTSCDILLDSVHVINDHIQYKDRLIKTGRYIAGIDYDRFATTLRDEKVKARISELESLYEGKKVIIGVDRLDYTKGLTEKMEGFRVFLDQHPELRDKVILIQIAIPSREDVKEYQDLEGEVSKLVGQIIGKHATPHSTPLLYIHRSVSFEDLTSLYAISDVCFLTSRRDGLNLVASEYVACQDARNGVLVLSKFTGAASFLNHGSVLCNPSSAEGLSDALYKAMMMGGEERRRKHNILRDFVTAHTR
ncbi:putative alpha,alpha-trehalose-phosphate synthase [UDP-forming] [Penicillium oxalicum 114-2]|uniref:Putative alpha,alpha-trehalose-phosphate synthase [UDP-forming] n=1 Tax=Penicillium oxalicum (strain 114-2 / CGMCC 5302) TaxID=933388 RepID=S7Z8F6_PENO1|nr:putative alpha,alpha-trehalose-phosphate synthase [UDP-forming] [Penicillium oxalicum 114-2]